MDVQLEIKIEQFDTCNLSLETEKKTNDLNVYFVGMFGGFPYYVINLLEFHYKLWAVD